MVRPSRFARSLASFALLSLPSCADTPSLEEAPGGEVVATQVAAESACTLGGHSIHDVLEVVDRTRFQLTGVQSDVCSGASCPSEAAYPVVIDVTIQDDFPTPTFEAYGSLATAPDRLLWRTTTKWSHELPPTLRLGVGCVEGTLTFGASDLEWKDRNDSGFSKSKVVLTPRTQVPELSVRVIVPETTPVPTSPVAACAGAPLDPARIAALAADDSDLRLSRTPAVGHSRTCDGRRGGCTPWRTHAATADVRLSKSGLAGKFFVHLRAQAPDVGGLDSGTARIDQDGRFFRQVDDPLFSGTIDLETTRGRLHEGCISGEVTNVLRDRADTTDGTRQGRDYHFVVKAEDPALR